MGKVINLASSNRTKRINLRGLSEHEKEYAYKLISILRHEKVKRRALEESIDVLYNYMNYEIGQDARKK